MKREAFFAECLSFAMKAPPQRVQNSPHRLICFPPRYCTPSIGGIYINVVTGGRNDRKLVEVANCPSCAVPLRLY